MTKARDIIKSIEQADECEIMEFDFDPCFKLLRDMEEAMTEYVLRVEDGQLSGEDYTYNHFNNILGRKDDRI